MQGLAGQGMFFVDKGPRGHKRGGTVLHAKCVDADAEPQLPNDNTQRLNDTFWIPLPVVAAFKLSYFLGGLKTNTTGHHDDIRSILRLHCSQ